MKSYETVNHDNASDAQAAIDAGVALGLQSSEVQRLNGPDGVPFIVAPRELVATSVEKLGRRPARLRAVVGCETPEGFVAYVNRYKSEDAVIFIRRLSADIEAVFDYHTQEGTAFGGEHRAHVRAVETPEFKRWKAIHGKPMSQVAFAEFLEDNLQDIASPDGATLLELAQDFRVKKDVTFSSKVSMHSGQVQLTYNEAIDGGGASAGTVAAPEKFVLGIAPYFGNQLFKVDVRFRFRLVEGGKLNVWIDIVRLEDLMLQAFDQIVAGVKVSIGADDAPTYIEGTAPTSAAMWGGE